MQIQTTKKYYLTSIRMAIIKKTRECVEKKKSLSTISGKVNWFNNYGKQYTGSSKNLKLLYDLAVLLKYKSK